MCGLAGFWHPGGTGGRGALLDRATIMARTLQHRGPDDEGVWVDEGVGIALGHTRLAVVDLSPMGAQPMVSADGRQVLIYNGEVYNAAELRAELTAKGCRFRGRSDTEVILEGCATWGALECVTRLIGMFAFALWDREARTLTLVRDRLGIKPLYWAQFGRFALFGSELKALRAHPGWQPEVDREVLADYLRLRYIAAPRTIYRGVHKLPPGHLLELPATQPARLVRYWDPVAIAAEGPIDEPPEEAEDRLHDLLADAVGRRMLADVPLGAFLSGGIDSSTVVALMQAQSSRPVRTFSIGFRDADYDEAPYARAVANHLGTEHTELYVDPGQALDAVPRLVELFDEPFADSSQIPTYILAELTRRHVTVALSGDGGDELFAGYPRYHKTERIWRAVDRVPLALRRRVGRALRAASPLLGRSGRADAAARLELLDRLELHSSALAETSPDRMYRYRMAHWRQPEAILAGSPAPEAAGGDLARRIPDFLTRMQLTDITGYLPDDILTKVDRSTMAVSLEARVPILDHRVVASALRLPRALKLRDGKPKWILRKILARYVPADLIDRPKKGFSVPLGAWLRGPLRDWAEDLLAESRLRQDGYFRAPAIRQRWEQHLTGAWDEPSMMWDVLMFQAWLRHNAEIAGSAVAPARARDLVEARPARRRA